MSMQPVYLVSVKNLSKFLEALRHAQAPEKVALRFVEELGFTSTNDRLFIPLLKAMKFLDEGGKPTARYHAFLDDTQWKTVLAAGVKDAYPDLFRVVKNANALPKDQLSGKLKSLAEGKLSPAVLGNVTRTFIELVKLADFTPPTTEEVLPAPPGDNIAAQADPLEDRSAQTGEETGHSRAGIDVRGPTLVYRIEIVLPAVRDQAIYDAIFRSAKEHLLK
jgi:Family of unknown function (DUF5343)